MGFMDKAKDAADKAKQAATKAVDQHGDKIKDASEKAGAFVDKKTGGKYTDKIVTGQKKLQDGLDGLDGKNDDIA